MTLIKQLIQKGILDKEKALIVEDESKSSDKKIEEIILDKNFVPEEILFRIKSQNLKMPLREVTPEDVPLKILELIPEESARYYKMIPLNRTDKILEVGMVYPEDLKTKEALKFLAREGKFSYQISLITLTSFSNILKQYKTLRREVSRALEELETELKTDKRKTLKASMVERIAEEAPITKMVAVMLRYAVDRNASDIHIEPTKEKLRIRFRLDGILHSSLFLPIKVHSAVVARIKILSNLKIDEARIPQDGRFSAKINERDVDFRVSTFPTTLGEKVVMRVLDPTHGLKDFEKLGLNQRDIKILKATIKKPYGLILSTGPTGCGKSTTLYTILQILNKEESNIITLEDPVEYFLEGVNQSQIRPEIGYSFAQGLRHMLRQDPDIIMVGEIRDEETAALAIHAALTGHIVLSTLHTTNVLGVIPRLIDLGVAPFLIPASLRLSLAQRLTRKLCVFCKQKKRPNLKIKQMIVKEMRSLPKSWQEKINFSDLWIWEPKGCKKCRQEGYVGRLAVFETLEMTNQLADVTLKEPSEVKIREEALRQGIITMKQDGIIKALRGETSIEEILRVAEEK